MYKMTILWKIKPYSDTVDYFKELPFYNKPIKKPKVKHLKNIDQLVELPFYEQLSVIKTDQAFNEQLSVIKTDQAFKGICHRDKAMSYRVEVKKKKDPIVILKATKLRIKNLFSDLLNETKGFKYQITVKILLKKYKLNGKVEFAPVYFNSVTKTVITDLD